MNGSNRQTITLWLSGSVMEGRNTRGTLFFKRDTIYSGTGTPVARIAVGTNGAQGVLFASAPNTGIIDKHCAEVFAACLDIRPAFIVPKVTAANETEHGANLLEYTVRIRVCLEHADNSTNENDRAFYIMTATSHRDEALAYAKFFDLSADNLPVVPRNELAVKKQEKLRRDADAARETLARASRAWHSEPPDLVQ